MPLFNSKVRYALAATVDMAMQPSDTACQSREISLRQNIPGPYLDQILAALKGAGLVRSIRGAGGGYNLARTPEKISVGDVVRATMRNEKLISNACDEEPPPLDSTDSNWVIREFEEQAETLITQFLDSTTIATLAERKSTLNDTLSIMPAL